jgi:hypothetical protein
MFIDKTVEIIKRIVVDSRKIVDLGLRLNGFFSIRIV